jgi:hypothetical protein
MKRTAIDHSRVLAFALSLCALAFAGCAVQTASGDPSQTEEQAQAEESGEPAAKASEQDEPGPTSAAPKPEVCKNGVCLRPEAPTGPTPWAH